LLRALPSLVVTKDKIIWFVVACLLYLCFVLMLLRALPSLVVSVHVYMCYTCIYFFV